MSTENTHWRCRWFGHRFEGRGSSKETSHSAPASVELARRTDLDSLISTTLVFGDMDNKAAALKALGLGGRILRDYTYQHDICVRCGEIVLPPKAPS